MGSTEQWDFTVTCKQCGAKGMARTTELDGWAFMRAKRSGEKVRWIEPPAGFELKKPSISNPITADLIARGVIDDRVDDDAEHIICSACKIPGGVAINGDKNSK